MSFNCLEKELVTPPLDGLILPGVTRMSLLDLAKEWVRHISLRCTSLLLLNTLVITDKT